MMGYNSIAEILAANLSPDVLKKTLENFNASTNKTSFEEGKKGSEKNTKTSSVSSGNLGAESTYITEVTGSLTKNGEALVQVLDDFKNAADPTNFTGANYLRDEAQKMANELGLGQSRMSEIKTTIADALPEMIKYGVSESKALTAMTDIPKELGINTSLGKEALVEMALASEVAGVSASKLALEFKGVGMSLYDVGDRMAEVAIYAKSVGVNVQAVSALVVNNLKQLNLFNFDNGVKGLGKMASQATMLGISMEDTFAMAEKLMSPEKAIEMSAALQRLGVSSSALLDPLKAMDLAQNDPEALQKEMINVSKEFTKLKADGTGFEILPGAKRRLREVADAMGMTASELANMSIKSADLDMKMSKIKFPSLATSEEDKLLIANMAQMKGGEAVLQIKNDITGKMDDINVKDLTADQITKLREQQANQDKSIEQIALDQLTELEKINKSLSGSKVAVSLGKATTPTMDRFYNVINKAASITTTNLTQGITTENVRGAATEITSPLEQEMVRFLQGKSTWETVESSLTSVKDSLVKIAGNIVVGAGTAGVKTVGDVTNEVSKIYSPLGVQPTQIVMDPSSPFTKQIESLIEQFKTGGVKETKTTADVNMNIKVDAGSSLPNGLTPAQFTPAIEKYFETPEGKSNLTKWITDNNSGLTTGKS